MRKLRQQFVDSSNEMKKLSTLILVALFLEELLELEELINGNRS